MNNKIPVSGEAMKKIEEEHKREAKKHESLAALVKLVRKKALSQSE